MPSNLTGFPEPFQPLQEPIRSLVGKWESALVSNGPHSHGTLRWMCDAVEGFWYDHPKTKRPEQILITDVEDWREARLAAGHCWNVVRRDLCALKAFYSYLVKVLDYRLDNPVNIPPVQIRTQDLPVESGVYALHPDLRPALAD
jgi:hypothetical protein